jgi:hypothetical protein
VLSSRQQRQNHDDDRRDPRETGGWHRVDRMNDCGMVAAEDETDLRQAATAGNGDRSYITAWRGRT